MKSLILILSIVATLSCRAENSASTAAAPAATPAASEKSASEKSAEPSAMAAVQVSASSDLTVSELGVKEELASMRAQQKAAMARELADQTQRPKMAFVGILPMEQPMLSLPKLPNLTGTVATLAPAVEGKNAAR